MVGLDVGVGSIHCATNRHKAEFFGIRETKRE